MVISRLKALGSWLAEGKHSWIALFVTSAALVACLRPGSSEPLIRLTGLALQILGVATAIWGLLETRKFFGQPSPVAQFHGWLSRCPIRRRTIVGAVGMATSHSSAGKLRGYSSVSMDPSAAPDVRLGALERNVGLIQERITSLGRELDGELSVIRSEIKKETETRAQVALRLDARLEGVATGGIHIAAIGAVWLFVGAVLSTAAPELASLAK